MTVEEERVAPTGPSWMMWALDRLDDDELAHCGHLDMCVVDPQCRFCEEIIDHLRAHTMQAPAPFCELCERWRYEASILQASWLASEIGATLGSWWTVDGGSWQLVGCVERGDMPTVTLHSTNGDYKDLTVSHLNYLIGLGRARVAIVDGASK
ncbi:hypothetical protein [Gordonia sihwensis]|uniref:hypothetical protein n=1 Tax=Gordonia sihwensis TaxID=173559 RepID=UPI003D986655